MTIEQDYNRIDRNYDDTCEQCGRRPHLCMCEDCDFPGCDHRATTSCENCDQFFCPDHGLAYPAVCWKCGGFNADA